MKEQFQTQWAELSEKFIALSEREKWMATIGGAIGVFFLCLTFLIEPVMAEHSRKQANLMQLHNSLQQLEGQIDVINSQLQKDPNIEIDKQYRSVLQHSQDLSMRLSNLVDGLVTPEAMAPLLEQVLNRTNKLHLISLQSLPSESVILDGSNKDSGYYIHPVRIELTGNYFDIQSYLAQLEALPMKYYWRSFDYQVKRYPTASLTLEVYTLGEKQEFIGG